MPDLRISDLEIDDVVRNFTEASEIPLPLDPSMSALESDDVGTALTALLDTLEELVQALGADMGADVEAWATGAPATGNSAHGHPEH